MPDDNSAEKFGEDAPPPSEGDDKAAEDGRMYGSGGSYGYGGAFEHGGQRGYDVSFHESLAGEGSTGDRYEAQGKFGRDTEGYEREGIGHPGKDEKRPTNEATKDAPSAEPSQSEDARKGYSQESGYAQSGGNPAPGGAGSSARADHKADTKKVSRKSN